MLADCYAIDGKSRRKSTSAVPSPFQTLDLTLRGNIGKWDKCFLTAEATAHIGFQRGDLWAVQSVFGEHWYTRPISCNDSSSHGEPRPGVRSLDTWVLRLVQHYLNSAMPEITLQQIFAIIPATTTRYITFGLRIILETLSKIQNVATLWPHEDQKN